MKEDSCPVAIIGMSCFFPKSSGLKAYWRLLFQGLDAISEVPATHWSKQDYFDPDPRTPDRVYCTRGGFISPIDFDPSEFGIPPSSLEATDTSQLLALAAAKQALRDAGLPIERRHASVILGVTGTQELVIPLSSRLGFPKWRRALQDAGIEEERCERIIRNIADSYVAWQEGSFPGLLGNVVAGRISNRLDLSGTNCVVDAACASSFAALHLALLELTSGRSDLVITGGVDTLNDIFMHMCFAKTQILSPTGDARPFSNKADGTVLGEGVGLVVLKRLADAERDGDRVYAVIRGIGSASDGRSQSIYAPRIEGQVQALETAYAAAGIDPAAVELVEAHGTGTRVGDKVEFQALCQVMGKTGGGQRCAVGSVKSMIGHTKAAAGVAGLIKAALAVYHKVLPPTLKADEPDPALQIESSPFYLNTRTRPWLAVAGQPRRAGVSAFGFGGSNFHLVIEEHRPEKPCIAWDGSVQILAFSADRRETLVQSVDEFWRSLADPFNESDWARAAAATRAGFDARHPFRMLQVVEDPDPVRTDLQKTLEALQSQTPGGFLKLPRAFFGGPLERGKLAFLFPGQGSQYPGMGRDLVCRFPAAMAVLESAERRTALKPRLGDLIYPHAGVATAAAENALRATAAAQPAIGAISLALLRTLEGFGVGPDAAAGHSFGELTALCAAGWLDEADFMDLAAARGRAMAQAEPGAMLAVRAPLSELTERMAQSKLPVVLANRNAPDQGVLSGSREAIAQAAALCRQNGYALRQLPVGGAFHSPLMHSAQTEFLKALDAAPIRPGPIPVYSNNLGGPYPADAAAARQLLSGQMLQPVDFVGEIEAMYAAGIRTFVEVGPRTVMTGLVAAILKDRPFQTIALDGSNGKQAGLADLAKALCHLAALGYPVRLENWESPQPPAEENRMRIPVAGANFRKPDPARRPNIDPSPEANPRSRHEPPRNGVQDRVHHSEAPLRPLEISFDSKDTMAKDINGNTASVTDALRSVQEGLKAIQAIQIQTAQAHEKFLETQSETARVLLELVRSTGRLAGIPAGGPEEKGASTPGASAYAPTAAISQPTVSTVRSFMPPAANPAPTVSSQPPSRIAPPADAPQPAELLAVRSGLETALMTVVSELTGYPVAMLGLDMDIEADLGIDSIKRVEILSALEERMPGLPAVAPEDMGRLKTLGQIVDFLSVPRLEQPVAAVAAPLSTEPAPTNNADRQTLTRELLDVVSILTGYPVAMLGLDMDIEADLGIDSIKRVEILSALEERMPGLPAVAPEDMGRLKTLGQIVGHFSGAPRLSTATPTDQTTPTATSTEVPAPACVLAAENPGGRLAARQVVAMQPAPPIEPPATTIPNGRKIFITDDRAGLSQAVLAELGNQGINAVLMSADILKFKKDLPPAAGLVVIQDPASKTMEADLKNAFELTRAVAADLQESAKQQAAFFTTVTRMDGAFGFEAQPVANPVQGALAGLAKTAAAEWPEVICHAVDLSPDWGNSRDTARALIREFMSRGPVEIGLSATSRRTPVLVPQDYPDGDLNLDPGDPVVISGGARGITAVCALELARRVRPAIILLGRSPEPVPEPEWMRDLESEADIKKALLQTEFAAASAKPAEVERRLKQLLASREVARTLDAIHMAGAPVAYYAVDVRDSDQVQTALADARSRFGTIRGLIHGAGVLEDRLIAAKSMEQFERVFDTKLMGFRSLLDAASADELKTIVIFSSVTARIGNRGQADYAMANEALNKLAWAESQRRPGCRVVSINWGPWECGMVTPSIRREFERQGVTLLPASDGARSLLRELGRTDDAPAEVVIGGALNPVPAEAVAQNIRPELALLFEREIDVENHPVLGSHVIDGKAVVPMALMAEWFGHGALHENPGMLLHGIEDLRILNGIRLDAEPRLIRILAGKARRKNGFSEVDLELRNGASRGKDILHSRARVILTEDYSRPPAYRLPAALSCNHYPRSASEIYEKILFHGSHLQGLRWVQCCTADGMVADVTGAPAPAQWIVAPLRNSWLCDPLVLDSAFQMASLWCYEQHGCVSLPSHAASYRQFRTAFPAGGVKVVLEVREATPKKMRGDFIFLDAESQVIARLIGYEAVMDPLLNRAFKPEHSSRI